MDRASTSPGTESFVYFAAFIAAFTAVAYELMLASYATFLLGATIFQYSLVISLMMASMGLGSLLTHRNRIPIGDAFIAVELVLAAVAAFALPILYYVFAAGLPARFAMGSFVVVMGTMIGMEIPLLNSLGPTDKWLPRILFFDYLGGFLGGLIFPIVLVPRLGLFRVAAVLSFLNAAVAVALCLPLRARLGRRFAGWAAASLVMLVLATAALFYADTIRQAMESRLFSIKVP